MNKRVLIIVLIILVGGAVVYGLTANNSGSKDNTSSSNTNSQSQSSQTSAKQNTQASAVNEVSIQGFAFTPSDITVKKGTTVTWTNNDSTVHTVQETDSNAGPNSSNLSTGNKYQFTFDKTGTYHYHCSIHPDMTGTVTVTE